MRLKNFTIVKGIVCALILVTFSCKKDNDEANEQPPNPTTYFFKAEIQGEESVNFEYQYDPTGEIGLARIVNGDITIGVQDPSCANWYDCLRSSLILNGETIGEYRPELFQIGLPNNPSIIHSFHNSAEFDTLQMTVEITQLVKGNPGFIVGKFNGQMRKVDTDNNFEILARPTISGTFTTPLSE